MSSLMQKKPQDPLHSRLAEYVTIPGKGSGYIVSVSHGHVVVHINGKNVRVRASYAVPANRLET